MPAFVATSVPLLARSLPRLKYQINPPISRSPRTGQSQRIPEDAVSAPADAAELSIPEAPVIRPPRPAGKNRCRLGASAFRRLPSDEGVRFWSRIRCPNRLRTIGAAMAIMLLAEPDLSPAPRLMASVIVGC